MKVKEKAEAVGLRQRGFSVRKIADLLLVSKGTVSRWVRDVPLSPEQRESLEANGRSKRFNKSLGLALAEQARTARKKFQDSGRNQFNTDGLFQLGCMLYWAEGEKGKNVIAFSNADPDMVRVFMRFLRESLALLDNEIMLSVRGFLNNGLSKTDIESFWLRVTKLPSTQLRKGLYDTYSARSQRKKRNLLYGTVYLKVCNTEALHKIYGGIAECCGVETKFLW